MEIIQKGQTQGPKILCLSGMMTHWRGGYGGLGPLLEEKYQVYYVKYDGAQGEGTFTSIEDQAAKVVQKVQEIAGNQALYAYGSSMGANVLVEALKYPDFSCQLAFLDAPFLISFPHWLCRFLAKRLGQKVHEIIETKDPVALEKLIRQQTDSEVHLELLKDYFDLDLSAKTIENQSYSCYRMRLDTSLQASPAKPIFICGDQEKWALRSYKRLKKYRPDTDLYLFDQHDHLSKKLHGLHLYLELFQEFII
ncbi:hypothetical protein CL176_09660 [Suicoccus acidiformans]|uniref:Serine aminopeptidase S33 domain-containing protein n=1 Tax=Suicoccus acidiformans TaxID=2036206 RepID=A0A347WMD3_9LACT|nr:hypothetical protein [Suicoccus acidiformans]AXY26240.1 hypothetical protein CL176_09660 [Suicoccus acidiformans]